MGELVLRQDGAERAARMFDDVERSAADLRPAWDRLAARFVAAEKATFAAEGGASGHWAALSPRYAAQKAVRFPGKTILRATDLLYRSLTDSLDIDIREPHQMILGSDVPYGRYHQDGKGRRHRPPIDLSDVEYAAWVEVIADHLTSPVEVAA